MTSDTPGITFKTIEEVPSAVKCVDECQKLGVDRVNQGQPALSTDNILITTDLTPLAPT